VTRSADQLNAVLALASETTKISKTNRRKPTNYAYDMCARPLQ